MRLLLIWLFFSPLALAHHEAGGPAAGTALLLAADESGASGFPPLERHYSVDGTRNQRPPVTRWGAVSRHPTQTFFVWGKDTESAAVVAARGQCERNTNPADGPCQVVRAFRRCASEAAALHQDFELVQEADTLADAESQALEECRLRSGDACVRRWAYCTDGSGAVFTESEAWGAVARPVAGGGEAVLVKDRKASETALIEANWHCGQVNKQECETVFHFGQCGAYAESPDGKVYGWSRGSDRKLVETGALERCAASAGVPCRVVRSDCNQVVP